MRLIDADKLLEETRRDRDYAAKNGFMDMYHERQVLIERIEAQPTAYEPDRPYDLDKVVEQLYKLRQYGNEYDEYYDNEMYKIREYEKDTVNSAIDKAIEIVKAGGTDA